ncbi:hypothetical protein D3C74_51160 [compost metagenome]
MKNMILVDPNLLKELETSTCYGIAHDSTCKECKNCDVQQECSGLSSSNRSFDSLKVLKPDTEKAISAANVRKQSKVEDTIGDKKGKKVKPNIPEGMPDTKGLGIEELQSILEKRGGTCAFYENPGIYKMRLIMAIKQTYK